MSTVPSCHCTISPLAPSPCHSHSHSVVIIERGTHDYTDERSRFRAFFPIFYSSILRSDSRCCTMQPTPLHNSGFWILDPRTQLTKLRSIPTPRSSSSRTLLHTKFSHYRTPAPHYHVILYSGSPPGIIKNHSHLHP